MRKVSWKKKSSLYLIKAFSYFSKIYLWQTSNALLILRYIARFLTQRMTEKEFVRIFAKSHESTETESSSTSSSSDEEDDDEQKSENENNNGGK